MKRMLLLHEYEDESAHEVDEQVTANKPYRLSGRVHLDSINAIVVTLHVYDACGIVRVDTHISVVNTMLIDADLYMQWATIEHMNLPDNVSDEILVPITYAHYSFTNVRDALENLLDAIEKARREILALKVLEELSYVEIKENSE